MHGEIQEIKEGVRIEILKDSIKVNMYMAPQRKVTIKWNYVDKNKEFKTLFC